jgi:ABC-type spermidine/putrescine transport system permease subunit II
VATAGVLAAAGLFALKASAGSVATIVVVGGLLAAGTWLMGNAPSPLSGVMLWVWSVLVIVFLYLPLVFVVVHSFNDNKALEVWSRFSTRWYGEMWDNTQLTGSVKSSFAAAAVAAIIAVVLGTLAGIALARRPGKWTVGFMAIVLLVLTTPEIVDATGLQLQFVSLEGVFREGLVPLWIGQSIFSAAVVTLIVRARMQGMDDSLEQAANDLFATPFTAFRQITLPLIAPAVLAGGLLAFTFALDNVIISDFVKAPGTNTFPTYVLGQVKTVRKPDIAAMATLLIGVTLFVLLSAAMVLRRSGDDTSKIAATLTGN